MLENKIKREIKTIADEITKTLKVIDDLSRDDSRSVSNKQKVVLNTEVLKNLRKTASGIRDDIAFFAEGKSLGEEILEKAQKDYLSLGAREKEKILKFINESYEEKQHVKAIPETLNQESLVRILTDFNGDIDRYIEKLNSKLDDLEESIRLEEDKQLDIRKEILREEAELGEKELALIEENRRLFDQEIEKLELLEEELSLAIMERDNQKQIDGVRDMLDGKIN